MQKVKNFPEILLRSVASPIFLWLTFAWFIFQTVWMALSTNLGISPDESYHYGLIQLFAHNGWLPFIHNQAGYYWLGEVVHSPFILYHYLFSLPYHLFSGSSHALEILRLLNVPLAALSFFLANRLSQELKLSPLAKNLSLFMLANTLMFVFLSGMLNYDNLLIPLSLLSFILVIKVIKRSSITLLIALLAALFAGLLTAVNFLPVAFAIVVTITYRFRRNIVLGPRSEIKSVTNSILVVVAILLLALFSQRYLFNLAKYHTYSPACDKVNTVTQCMQNGIYKRSVGLKATAHSVGITPMEYFTSWVWNMNNDTFGILGHKSIPPNRVVKFWTEVLLLISPLIIVRLYRNRGAWTLLLLFWVFYTLTLFTKNYLGYEHSGANLGVQGRYLFPFLPLAYFLLNKYVLQGLARKSWQSLYVLLTIAIFIVSALPTYLVKASPDWYTNRSKAVNASLHAHLDNLK